MEEQAGGVPVQPEDRTGAVGRVARAKAFWTVTAGILMGEAMPEHSKQWCYSNVDYEQDHEKEIMSETIFARMDREAHAYARSITHPAYVNWVRVEFLWV
ncbi:MAG TPA: hypothetical protein VK638_19685 [Edaphobacter sp.]|nr:hypothetical protein [Edaphobacter sp.]